MDRAVTAELSLRKDTLSPEAVARARDLGSRIDRAVSQTDAALGMIGVALDAFATSLRTQPEDTYADLAPWLTLAGECMTYVETGAVGVALEAFLAGDLTGLQRAT
jgi:hypothetical protein